jgi:tetratricopeptide (TPR) repeat protein
MKTISEFVSELAAQLQAGHLSEDTMFQLLANADNLSAQGDWPDAWRALETVEQAAKQTGHARYLAEAAMHRGILCYRQGEAGQAIAAWLEAMERFSGIDQTEGIANSHSNLGITYKALGEMSKAQEHLQAALDIYRAIDYRRGQAAALSNLGLVYRDQGHPEEAARSFKESLALHRALGDLSIAARECTTSVGHTVPGMCGQTVPPTRTPPRKRLR